MSTNYDYFVEHVKTKIGHDWAWSGSPDAMGGVVLIIFFPVILVVGIAILLLWAAWFVLKWTILFPIWWPLRGVIYKIDAWLMSNISQ